MDACLSMCTRTHTHIHAHTHMHTKKGEDRILEGARYSVDASARRRMHIQTLTHRDRVRTEYERRRGTLHAQAHNTPLKEEGEHEKQQGKMGLNLPINKMLSLMCQMSNGSLNVLLLVHTKDSYWECSLYGRGKL